MGPTTIILKYRKRCYPGFSLPWRLFYVGLPSPSMFLGISDRLPPLYNQSFHLNLGFAAIERSWNFIGMRIRQVV